MDIKNLDINTADISGELAVQASKFMYVCELYCQALGEYDKGVLNVDKTASILDASIRAEAISSGNKITEKTIESAIKSDPGYLSAAGSLIHLKVKRDLLKSLKEAWAIRSESLLKIASMQRDEMFISGKDKVLSLESLGSY